MARKWLTTCLEGRMNPENDLYFTGTVNQLSGFGHSTAIRAMIRIIKSVQSQKLTI
jgi:hypothetical protein